MDPAQKDFHAGHKLGWIEAIASDPAMTGATLKVAVAISQRTGRDGIARTASQPWIAKRVHLTDRAVRTCIGRLRRAGYLERITPGGRMADGKGRAAEFRIVTPLRSSSASSTGETAGLRNSSSGNPVSDDAEASFQNPGSQPPPFPSYSHKNLLTRAQTSSGDSDARRQPDCPWRAIKALLARHQSFGPDIVAACLDPLQAKDCANGVLTLTTSRGFLARHVSQNYERFILDAWREIDPDGRRVIVKCEPATPLPPREDDDVAPF